jgi:hypothetical protein
MTNGNANASTSVITKMPNIQSGICKVLPNPLDVPMVDKFQMACELELPLLFVALWTEHQSSSSIGSRDECVSVGRKRKLGLYRNRRLSELNIVLSRDTNSL